MENRQFPGIPRRGPQKKPPAGTPGAFKVQDRSEGRLKHVSVGAEPHQAHQAGTEQERTGRQGDYV